MRRPPLGSSLALGVVLLIVGGGGFAACARGAGGAPGGGDGGSGGSSTNHGSTGTSQGTGGQSMGNLGDPCKKQSDCDIGKCEDLGNGKYCTTECPPACPSSMYCGLVNGKTLCVPRKGQCEQCSDASACTFGSDRCLTAPLGDKFCGNDCTTDGTCPNGFECVDGDNYENGGGSGSGGGSGGSTGAGASGAGGAGGSGGGSHPPGKPYKFCAPSGAASCPCDDKRDGVSHDCDVTNSFGTCSGSEVCDANKGKFVNCSAKTPKKESCNGKDDNCNDQVDEGDPNDLCSHMGDPPVHASWACHDASCSLGACDPGWANYPHGSPEDGCPCQVEAGEPNDTCAQATNGGSVSDAGGNVTLTGTLSSDTDVDVFKITTVDTDEGTTDSYHVHLDFTLPATNNEFVMDVIRGATCTDTPTGPAVNITSYDWCVNGVDGGSPPQGLGPCGNAAGQNHCVDLSSPYFVRVHRKAGAAKTCTTYKITATAKGGTCDFTQKCP